MKELVLVVLTNGTIMIGANQKFPPGFALFVVEPDERGEIDPKDLDRAIQVAEDARRELHKPA